MYACVKSHCVDGVRLVQKAQGSILRPNTAACLGAHVLLIFLTHRQMKGAQQRLLSVLTALVMAAVCCAAGLGGAASTNINQAV